MAKKAPKVKKEVSTGNQIAPIMPPGMIVIGDTIFGLASDLSLKATIDLFESIYARQKIPLNRYVLTFAHAHLYKDSPRHALVVKKAPGTLHEGFYNLPGGRIEPDEKPAAAALRELKEETGLDGSFPQLVGAILPSGNDVNLDNFIVYVYRCMVNPGGNLKFPEDQPASWQPISDCRNGKYVQSLAAILPLIAADIMGFVIQDIWWAENSQSLVTFLQHSISDAAKQTKQRFAT